MEPKQRRILLGTLIAFLVIFSLCNLDGILAVLGFSAEVTMPILVGFALAFVLNLPLRFLERLWDRLFEDRGRRAKRPVCLLLTVLLVSALIALLIFALVPQLVETLMELIRDLPDELGRLKGLWEKLSGLLSGFSVSLPPLELDHGQIADFLERIIEEHGHTLMEHSLEALLTVVGTVFDTVVAVVLSIYVLARKERIGAQVKKFLHAVLPKRGADWVARVASLSSRCFGKFLTGQLTEAVILGVLCFGGMLLLRMPFALLISVFIGVTALIPVFGAFIGIGAGAVLILSVEPIKALWFVIFVIVLQQLEGNLIYPRVVGKSVGLPGVWVLIAVTVGSSFGIVGMLLSVPITSVLYIMAKEFTEQRLKKKENGQRT